MQAFVNCWGLTCEIRLLGKQGLGRKQVCLHPQFLVMNLWCAGCMLAEGYTGFRSKYCKLTSVLGVWYWDVTSARLLLGLDDLPYLSPFLTVRYYFHVSFSWISVAFGNCMHMYNAFWVYSLLSSSLRALFCPPTHILLPLCSFLCSLLNPVSLRECWPISWVNLVQVTIAAKRSLVQRPVLARRAFHSTPTL